MDVAAYRREIRMFRGEVSNTAAPGGKRTLKGAGFAWYKVKAQPELSLYIDLSQIYLKAFRNGAGTYRFYHEANPSTRGGTVINATELAFVDSYNQKDGRSGLGYEQTGVVTVTLDDLNAALDKLAGTYGPFTTSSQAEQRKACAFVVIGFIEAARFKDVEDHVATGSPITDRSWDKHGDASKVMIRNG